MCFSRSAIAMCVCVSSGRDRWKDPVGASAETWVPLGSVWSGQRHEQNLGLSGVPFWPALSCWQIHWLVEQCSMWLPQIFTVYICTATVFLGQEWNQGLRKENYFFCLWINRSKHIQSETAWGICLSSGNITWQQPQPSGLHSSLPVLSVPDVDGDEVGDVVLVASDNTQVSTAATIHYCCTYFLALLISHSMEWVSLSLGSFPL